MPAGRSRDPYKAPRPLSRSQLKTPSLNQILKKAVGGRNFAPIRTGRRRGAGSAKLQPFPDQPPTWKGTLPEWAVYWAHERLGLKQGADFEYLYQFDLAPNGVDFFEFDLQLVIEIQGLYWHYERGEHQVQNDLERRVRIESYGLMMVFIDEDHALADPVYYLKEARNYRDHSRANRGGF